MRIVHVSPTDVEGGAARGAYNLHKSLQMAGCDSLVLAQRKYSDDPSVLTDGGALKAVGEALRDRFDRLPLSFYDWSKQNWWTVGWLPFYVHRALKRLEPDIVQFHWTGRGGTPINALGRLGDYPIVWTLRDMWPLTGGCHYTSGCEKYLTGCGACPQLNSRSRYDISRWQWRSKQRAWAGRKVTYVALSNWIGERARHSPLTFGNEVTVIPNGIDIHRFFPFDKKSARAAWQLPQDKRVILFGAMWATVDPRKGYAQFCESMRLLASEGWADRAVVVVFGADSGDGKIPFPTRYMGTLRDDMSLAMLYSAADVMAVPSIEENFGKTGIEAMACGTPTVGFVNTGLADIVEHRVDGYLAQHGSAEDLARGIAWCLDETMRGAPLPRLAREKITRCFDSRDIAARYVALYERVLREHRRKRRSIPEQAVAQPGGAA